MLKVRVEFIKLGCTAPHNWDSEQREFQPSGVLTLFRMFRLFKLLGKKSGTVSGLSGSQIAFSCVPRSSSEKSGAQNGSLFHRSPEGVFGGGCAA